MKVIPTAERNGIQFVSRLSVRQRCANYELKVQRKADGSGEREILTMKRIEIHCGRRSNGISIG